MLKTNFKNSRGFTLIELLVVIAIIGILSSVVLASLNSARTKGKDASAKGSMTSMRAQAELGVDSSGNYVADLCTSTATGGLGKLKDAVDAQVPTGNAVTCIQKATTGSAASAWAAVVTLNDGTFYCIDSGGYAGSVSARAAIGSADSASADVECN